MKKVVLLAFIVSFLSLAIPIYSAFASGDKIQKSGCCSYHGGVCGCSAGRALCCDGTLSSACGCN